MATGKAIPLFVALFGRVRVVHVARWYERKTTGEHCLRPTTVQYFWFQPRYCHYTIQTQLHFTQTYI